MPELLIFAHDHHGADPKLPPEQVAALPSLFDVIDVHPDGWSWGKLELQNPWFRVLLWSKADSNELEVLLSNKLPDLDVDGNPTTLWQYRGFHLNLTDPVVLAVAGAFLNDITRANAKFLVPANFSKTAANLTLARTVIPVVPA